MMTDPIADLLARIRNAALARHEHAKMPHSRMRHGIAEILKREGYLADVRQDDDEETKRKQLVVTLKYGNDKKPAFQGMRRVSKPGRRVYVGYDDVPRVLSGLGISILSTSAGLMSDREARVRKLGGELICEVW